MRHNYSGDPCCSQRERERERERERDHLGPPRGRVCGIYREIRQCSLIGFGTAYCGAPFCVRRDRRTRGSLFWRSDIITRCDEERSNDRTHGESTRHQTMIRLDFIHLLTSLSASPPHQSRHPCLTSSMAHSHGAF